MKSWIILALLFTSLGRPSFGQEFTRAVFHVTSVRSGEAKDWCGTGNCSAIRYTVEGYITSKDDPFSVEYVLECVEVLNMIQETTVVCAHVHAHEEYPVTVFSDGINFEHQFEHKKESSDTKEPTYSGYKIVSEKEVAKQKAK